jgi:heterodisulfide reductase subunit B
MTFAYFQGCKIPHYLPQYDQATRAVLGKLGVGLKEIEFGCCGYPIRDQDGLAYLYAASRNLALAHAEGLDILTPCKCCFGSLMKARDFMAKENRATDEVRKMLASEGLSFPGDDFRVRHLMQVLDQDVEGDGLAAAVTRPLDGLHVAVHYGCHALRPSKLTQFDNPAMPTIFERLIILCGADTLDYPQKLECCGNPLWSKNPELSLTLMGRKLEGIRQSGASLVACACTYCQMQLDQVQEQTGGSLGAPVPAVLLPQVVGLALGCSADELGIAQNRLRPVELEEFF